MKPIYARQADCGPLNAISSALDMEYSLTRLDRYSIQSKPDPRYPLFNDEHNHTMELPAEIFGSATRNMRLFLNLTFPELLELVIESESDHSSSVECWPIDLTCQLVSTSFLSFIRHDEWHWAPRPKGLLMKEMPYRGRPRKPRPLILCLPLPPQFFKDSADRHISASLPSPTNHVAYGAVCHLLPRPLFMMNIEMTSLIRSHRCRQPFLYHSCNI